MSMELGDFKLFYWERLVIKIMKSLRGWRIPSFLVGEIGDKNHEMSMELGDSKLFGWRDW